MGSIHRCRFLSLSAGPSTCSNMLDKTAKRVRRVRWFRRIKNFLLGPIFVPVFVLFFLMISVLTMQVGIQPSLPQGALFNFLEFRPNPRFDRAPWKINLDFADLERRRRVFLREQALKERQTAKFKKDVLVSVVFCSLAILSVTLCILRSDPRWDWPRGNDE